MDKSHQSGLRILFADDEAHEAGGEVVLGASKAFALCCTLDEAKVYRDELAFLQAIKATWTKATMQDKVLSDEAKEHALRQIISGALVSDEIVDIFKEYGKQPHPIPDSPI